MPWTPLKNRLTDLPLVLCGPLLRYTDRYTTTVFLALRQPCKVTLRVYGSIAGTGGMLEVKQIGTRNTVRLGDYLHVVAVTAVYTIRSLNWGERYFYNVTFGQVGDETIPVLENGTDLFDPDIVAKTTGVAQNLLVYPEPGAPALLPSFALPPEDINELRLIHASCRKPHGEARDALQVLDRLIKDEVSNSRRRPHQLFLTGDQIYSDDVADSLLPVLTEAGDILLGWKETLADVNKRPEELKPGFRAKIAEKDAGFSSEKARSHLFGLGEFYAMYLFAWSNVLWPPKLPDWEDLYPPRPDDGKSIPDSIKAYNDQRGSVEEYRKTLIEVRRALANIPSYMILDDHEVTDDWYITFDWCSRVLQKALGRRVLLNALLAYAIFQGWGNTPEQFNLSGKPGWDLLEAASQLNANPAATILTTIAARIGLPAWQVGTTTPWELTHQAGALDWHYIFRGAKYDVFVLDSRTWRAFYGGPKDPSVLLSVTAFNKQLPQLPLADPDGLTIVIAPGPVVGVEFVEELQQTAVRTRTSLITTVDLEAWSSGPIAFESLLARLFLDRPRVVIFSGDVHYGYCARLRYWATRPFGSPASNVKNGVLAQLTSSALKNESTMPPTHLLHDAGFLLAVNKLPPPPQRAGWNNAPYLYVDYVDDSGVARTGQEAVRSNPPLLNVLKLSAKRRVSSQPDWRYRIEYLMAQRPNVTPRKIDNPPAWDRERTMAAYLATAKNYEDYLKEWASGREIVGVNNLSDVTFHWDTGDDKSVTQELWWWLNPRPDPAPLYTCVVSLGLSEPSPDALPEGP